MGTFSSRICKHLVRMLLRGIVLLLVVATAVAMPAVTCVASVRGKKYDITAETVGEFSQQVESLSGLVSTEQSVLFRGKVLDPKDKLEDLGVSSGDILNVLKGRKARAPKPQLPLDMETMAPSAPSNTGPMLPDMPNGMTQEEMMKNMSPEKVQQAMQALDKMMESDVIEKYFGDDEKIEQARLQMLQSADEYNKMMPGFKDEILAVASDPEKWRQAMTAAKDQVLKLKELRKSGAFPPGIGGPNFPMPNLG